MKIKIGKKIFDATDNCDEKYIRIILLGREDEDKDFFFRWRNTCIRAISKDQYVIDIKYTDINSKGFLKNAYPLLNINFEFVDIFYEYKHIL